MRVFEKRPLGAVIKDVRLDRTYGMECNQFKKMLAEYGVLVFPKQELTDRKFVLFLEQMGPLTFTTGEQCVESEEALNIVSNVGRTTPPKSSFHSDSTYFKKPPAYTALRAVTLPSSGGDTLFTNQYWSYDTLCPNVKKRLDNKTFTHEVTGLDLSNDPKAETSACHPAFLKHPISGRTALYMSTPQRCVAVQDCCEEESRELVEKCYQHSIQERNIYRHHWKDGDVVIWDNSCTLHRADHSRVNGDRVLHRGLSLGYNA